MLTDKQDVAFATLNDYYGDAVVSEKNVPQGSVKITAFDEDGEPRARWIVDTHGHVSGAWDPDYVLDKYIERRQS